MKALKWLLPLYVAGFPYLCLWGLYGAQAALHGNPFGLMGLAWLAGLAAALAVLLTRRRWTARELALANMLIKLVHIPAYVFWFAAGMLLFLFMGALLAFVTDVMAISLSGLIGLSAILQCKKEGVLTGKQILLHGILQFVFCADVCSAIWLYGRARRGGERNAGTF